ncbi:DUF58 domain-containing protein [Paenibacillus montanisoli]|uniref:DUF58 domain-containing protein n=1 Tax=Paenibacillus montanisoli TaxID=2081970 RepID=A0A328TXK2_9BACL|nr:DUF58 domain-containing protein [Paenibacillus montanisoli]RAP74422.1 hypothetical protein DL346_20310 [Paenibacillus montanisoli]
MKRNERKQAGQAGKAEAMQTGQAGLAAPSRRAAERSKLRSRYFAKAMVILLLGASLAALYARGGAVEWLLATVLAAVSIGCLIFPYFAVGKLSVKRSVKEAGRLFDGGEMEVQLKLRFSRPVPFMWVGVSDEVVPVSAARDGKRVMARHAFLPGLKRAFQLTYTVKGLRRGELDFGTVQVTVGDMLGLTVRTFEVVCAGKALVHAKAPAGESFSDLPGFRPGSTSSERQPIAAIGGQMITAAARASRSGAGPDVRTYMPGDSPRRVDWRAMARGLGMQTRVSNAEEAGQLIVLLETTASAYGGDERLFDAHVGRAALLIGQAVREGKNVLLLTNGADGRKEQKVRAGERADLLAAEEQLARLQWSLTGEPLPQLVSDVVAGMSRGAALVCLAAEMKAGKAASAEPEPAADYVVYSAKLAAVRGVRLVLLLSQKATEAKPSDAGWSKRLQGTGCLVKSLPVPQAYRNQVPEVADSNMTVDGERGVIHVSTASS